MPVVIVLALLVLALVGCGADSAKKLDGSNQSSQIVISMPTSYQGLVGRPLHFTATLRNAGPKTARVVEVKNGCVCTDAKVADNELSAGEATVLTGTLTPRRVAGDFEYPILLMLGDRSLLRVTVRGTTTSNFDVRPKRVTLRPDAIAERFGDETLTIQNRTQDAIQLRAIEIKPPLPDLVVSESPRENGTVALAPGETTELHLTCPPTTLLNGDFDILVWTTHPEENVVVIPGGIEPADGLRVAPQSIHLGLIKSDRFRQTGPLASFHLSGDSGSCWHVETFSVPKYLASPKVSSLSASDLLVSLIPSLTGDPPGNLEALISLSMVNTSSRAKGLISVPVRGFLQHQGSPAALGLDSHKKDGAAHEF